jgi:hypothetical protein
MRRRTLLGLLTGAAATLSAARAGHEIPIYPSFYPHEIEIRTLDPGRAADALRSGKIQAYLGKGLELPSAATDNVRPIETLGSIILAQINPARTLDKASACGAVKAVAQELAGDDGFVLHPYPVTPYHGDYLHHADLAAAAAAHFAQTIVSTAPPRIRASGSLVRRHPDWAARDEWDVEVIEADAGEAMAAAQLSVNGRMGPPWLKTGWFDAERLLADNAEEGARREHADALLSRLTTADFTGLTEQINLERELVSLLTARCRKAVVGYTLKREYVNVEFSAGIENIGYDAIAGLASPMFIRTVKLKDFPWNGWLALGIDGKPTGAWNPVAGMTDPFGRMMGFAVTDAALMSAPYDAGWMLNRISDLPSTGGR